LELKEGGGDKCGVGSKGNKHRNVSGEALFVDKPTEEEDKVEIVSLLVKGKARTPPPPASKTPQTSLPPLPAKKAQIPMLAPTCINAAKPALLSPAATAPTATFAVSTSAPAAP
jgi:hypothetical protein